MSHADKRSVHTDALETLGTIIGPNEGRDAIHLAVEPIQAGEKLYPGQDIGIGADGKAYADTGKIPLKLGIVDPFLKEAAVFPDQWFWLVIYPRQITSLRHVWEHPHIARKGVEAYVSEPQEVDEKTKRSREWMEDFASNYGYTAESMIEAGKSYIRNGNYLCDGGRFEGDCVPDEYWDHFQRLTGIIVDSDDRHNFFTCSC